MRVALSAALIVTTASTALAQEPGDPTEEPTPPAVPEPVLSDDQVAAIESLIARRLEKERPRYELHFDVFMKGLYKNDQSNGSVWLGNPHPEGDNYSGQNGMAGVLGIRIDGRVVEGLTAGARLETRFGMLFADFYENGDLAVGDNGRPTGVSATGESLGMNHAAYAQLRGIYIDWARPPVPTVKSLRAGSSDLSHWNPWTVGKVRFIDRDNAKGLFVFGEAADLKLSYNLARVALPKLYGSAGFNTGIADPLVQNPFWARDAVYAGRFAYGDAQHFAALTGSYLLDEEADLNDPDALGSTNLLDRRDGVVTTIPRYRNANVTLEGTCVEGCGGVRAHVVAGLSYSDPDLTLVDNTIDNNQGLSPIPLKTLTGYAIQARVEKKLGPIDLRAEYFNIGADWVATMGTRREEDVLLTEGFLDGQLPTLNLANEFIDITEPFYETVIGWHGATLKPRLTVGNLELELEGTVISYNTNAQGRCTSRRVAGCQDSGGLYPDFLFPDGMTDTDFFTYANTNDRGRDPRSAYRAYQRRITYLGFARGALAVGRGKLEASAKFIRDRDLRDARIVGDDDYTGNLLTVGIRGSMQFTDRFSAGVGGKLDVWDEAHRSGAVVAGVARYPSYDTLKTKLWVEARYAFPGGSFASYRVELLNKDVETGEMALDFTYRNVVRSIASIYAGF